MKAAWNLAVDWYQMYRGTGSYHVFYLLGLLFLCLYPSIPKKWKTLFTGYTLTFLFLYFFPVTAGIIIRLVGGDVYWRMFWILPAPVLIAYAVTEAAAAKRTSAAGHSLILMTFLVILVLGGKNLYSGQAYIRGENTQKLMAETIQIADFLEAQKDEGETLRVAAPDEIVCEIRQYDAAIYLPYGRRINEYSDRQPLYDAMNRQPADAGELSAQLRSFSCGYLVHAYEPGLQENMSRQGFELLTTIGNYQVYKDLKREK